ncbi:2-C-methyl-D-erythritol 4-phosphate cytidylyltransferase [Roseivivax jejudonensis]|uniref:2-C-methyl-D-erythritol 4-phosphate cytidylyltransferase n=1 Tax=Roseivivax jejudonensis TaxID=1529041 RepID=A0A1X6YM59_9RHOB|nr:nucleotidyltransferase family protein [Roseivivax jejudonensis]SLN24588.1 2-C-methyl-D-erythritol 4-phosphate cytidylyltransferase [Roseivivax jejudonensis]
MPDSLMIFAAGFGTRMGALTADRPKPLITVAGRSLLDRTLDLARDHGIPQIVVNAHYRANQIVAHLAGSEVAVAVETPDILDTGGGLRAALPMLGDGPVFTSNSDAVWRGPNPFEVLAGMWRPAEMDALLLTVPVDHAVGRQEDGDFSMAQDGRLTRGGALVYTGVQILKTDRLFDIPDPVFSLNVVWNRIAAEGRLFGASYKGAWCDVGHPEGIALAETMLEAA